MQQPIQYTKAADGVRIAYRALGGGEPLILVHGSWTDHHSWDLVAPSLAQHFRVVAYDRRGHSESERPEGQGRLEEDVADLASLIEDLGLAPAHVAGNSRGAEIALRLATKRPDLFLSLSAHEPPLFELLADDPNIGPIIEGLGGAISAVTELLVAGNHEEGARQFMEVALGPGAWDQLPPQDRQTAINNAPTFLDEAMEPDVEPLDLPALASFSSPAMLSYGSASPPFFRPVVERIANAIPRARLQEIEGAGHIPHASHPELFVDIVTSFLPTGV